MGNSIFASLAFMSPLEILYEWVRGRVLLDDDVTDLISLPQFIPIIEMKSMGTLYFLNFYDTESNFLNFNFFFILSERTTKMNNNRGNIRQINFIRSRIINFNFWNFCLILPLLLFILAVLSDRIKKFKI